MTPKPTAVPPPRSPCIGICRLEPHSGWCEGCWRSLDEIAAWSQMPAPAQRAVLAQLSARRRLRQQAAAAVGFPVGVTGAQP